MNTHTDIDQTVAEIVGDFVLIDSLAHLLRRGHFYSENLFSAILGRYDVTSRQMVLLTAIGQAPGASQKMVGEMVALDVNTVSDTLRRMERKGLILREVSPTDARTICLRVAPRGLELLREVRPAMARFGATLSDRLTPEEEAQFKALARKMMDLKLPEPQS